ncbi:MAG: hypothetical protein WBS33_03695 [Verrucomicrobiia bacterium]
MTALKVFISGGDKYVAGMARALAFWSAPNHRTGQASVKASKLESNFILLRFYTEEHLSEFKRALEKYLPNSAVIIDD